MDYKQTLDYLYTRLPLFSRIGAAAYKADLHNTIEICNFLGNPQQQFKSIHVAGTNGKGSTCHMLAAIFQSAGYRTGLYTSPHLSDFRERIRIDGQPVPEAFIMDFTASVRPLIEKIEPSFFEITVGMAFRYFADEKVDIAIIETGLGGRLDSTNIIMPELSVITNIGWDHMNLLGDTLEKISAEKAGIIKPGIPLVIGEISAASGPVFREQAAAKSAPVTIAAEKRTVVDWHWDKHELVADVSETAHAGHAGDDGHKRYHLDLTGIYQLKNLLTTLEACHQMQAKGWNLPETSIREGLKKTKKMTGLHGRWEQILASPTVILDVAHNQDGIQQLLRQVEITAHHHLHIVTGFVKDKDVDEVLKLFPRDANYYFTQAQIPRALAATELEEKARRFDLIGKSWPDVNSALTAALDEASADDLVIVCGSVFLVGEVRRPVHANAPGHT
jgi:dihydrofolate synthase/folylpolyglutamate synthase